MRTGRILLIIITAGLTVSGCAQALDRSDSGKDDGAEVKSSLAGGASSEVDTVFESDGKNAEGKADNANPYPVDVVTYEPTDYVSLSVDGNRDARYTDFIKPLSWVTDSELRIKGRIPVMTIRPNSELNVAIHGLQSGSWRSKFGMLVQVRKAPPNPGEWLRLEPGEIQQTVRQTPDQLMSAFKGFQLNWETMKLLKKTIAVTREDTTVQSKLHARRSAVMTSLKDQPVQVKIIPMPMEIDDAPWWRPATLRIVDKLRYRLVAKMTGSSGSNNSTGRNVAPAEGN